jgi:hypothetical protein
MRSAIHGGSTGGLNSKSTQLGKCMGEARWPGFEAFRRNRSWRTPPGEGGRANAPAWPLGPAKSTLRQRPSGTSPS